MTCGLFTKFDKSVHLAPVWLQHTGAATSLVQSLCLLACGQFPCSPIPLRVCAQACADKAAGTVVVC